MNVFAGSSLQLPPCKQGFGIPGVDTKKSKRNMKLVNGQQRKSHQNNVTRKI